MKRLCRRIFLALTLALAVMPRGARAEFYTLEGRFQCLDRPDAVCFDAVAAKLEPPFAPPAAAAPDSRDSTSEAVVAELHPSTRTPPPAAKEPADPVLAIANRIERARPEAGDLDRLRRAAEAGDGRAIELLAWCALKGIGTGRDPVEAYLLYGKAAAAAVPRARQNQALVYESALSSSERQRVLDLQARADTKP
jgi:hypothetical protein